MPDDPRRLPDDRPSSGPMPLVETLRALEGEAEQEALTYVPPSDPPVVPSDDPQGVDVAAGRGTSTIDDDFAEGSDPLSEESDLTNRVREALRADAATSTIADEVVIGTVGSTVVLRGRVDTIDDGDALSEVASRVEGVDDVRDETEVDGL